MSLKCILRSWPGIAAGDDLLLVFSDEAVFRPGLPEVAFWTHRRGCAR